MIPVFNMMWMKRPELSHETPGVEPFVLDSPCGVMFSDGSELSPLAYRERLAKNGEDGYGSCVNLNKVKRRAIK